MDIRSPALQRLFADWCSWRRDREFPSRRDFDAHALKYLLGRINLLDVLHQPPRIRWRLHGSEIVRYVGRDLTGRFLHEIGRPEFRERAQLEYHGAIERRAPQCFTHHGILDERSFSYELLVLPLSDDDREINMLLAGFDFGAFR